MKINRSLALVKYRMNLRRTLNNADLEELKITLEEVKRALQLRSRK